MGLRLGLLFAAVAAGCAAVRSADGTRISVVSGAFPEYVERVFRDQNRVATELAFALDDPALDPARQDALAGLELMLLEACAPLNELAVAQRDGVRLGLRDSVQRGRQASRCETATRDAGRGLARIESTGS
jgi:hypothetical protein